MNKIVLVLALLAAAIAGLSQRGNLPPPPAVSRPAAVAPSVASSADHQPANTALAAAIASHARNVEVEAAASVLKVLPDDNDGLRHQRFLVRLPSGESLLVAHNIDLAERVADLRPGEAITLHGDYIWNAKGGVIHWTHHDPRGHHRPGWIKYRGHTYQ